MKMHFDFEVYSAVDIKSSPLDVYAAHESTKIILCAYAFDNGPVTVWEADKGKSPEDFRAGLRNPNVQCVAWNTGYERTVLKHKGVNIPLERWIDPMVQARYAGLPGKLKDCAKIPMIGVPASDATKNETLLIKKFCMPNKQGGRTLGSEHPADWAVFVDYCRKDVLTMRHILNWLEPRFPFPPQEQDLWMLDQVINERGLPVDIEIAKWADSETARIIRDGISAMRTLTGLENPNSVQQFLPWLQEQGYPHESLAKELLAQELENPELTDLGREAIQLRLGSAKASVKKFSVIHEMASPEVIA